MDGLHRCLTLCHFIYHINMNDGCLLRTLMLIIDKGGFLPDKRTDNVGPTSFFIDILFVCIFIPWGWVKIKKKLHPLEKSKTWQCLRVVEVMTKKMTMNKWMVLTIGTGTLVVCYRGNVPSRKCNHPHLRGSQDSPHGPTLTCPPPEQMPSPPPTNGHHRHHNTSSFDNIFCDVSSVICPEEVQVTSYGI